MRTVKVLLWFVAFGLSVTSVSYANPAPIESSWQPCLADGPRVDPWAVRFGATPPVGAIAPIRLAFEDDQAAQRRPVPVEYSDAYKVRAKIHKIAAFATLPIFIANFAVGQHLYNNPGVQGDSYRGYHSALIAGTAVLFGVNTVTGVWNLVEAGKDPNHRTKRTIHGLLMMAADAGFVATAALAPGGERRSQTVSAGYSNTHRTVALTSMGVATVSYLMMLFGR